MANYYFPDPLPTHLAAKQAVDQPAKEVPNTDLGNLWNNITPYDAFNRGDDLFTSLYGYPRATEVAQADNRQVPSVLGLIIIILLAGGTLLILRELMR